MLDLSAPAGERYSLEHCGGTCFYPGQSNSLLEMLDLPAPAGERYRLEHCEGTCFYPGQSNSLLEMYRPTMEV